MTTTVVKSVAIDPLAFSENSAEDRGVSLSHRIEIVLEWRGWTAREWSRRAGLAGSHVSTIQRRADEQDGVGRVSARTLQRLANAANVRYEWLATGEGSPESHEIEHDDPYPSRRDVIAQARLFGVSEATLTRIREISELEHDPGADYWTARIRGETGPQPVDSGGHLQRRTDKRR